MFDFSFLPPAHLQFVILADTHYMLNPDRPQVEFPSRRLQSARAERALALAAALEGAFVIHLGDLLQEAPESVDFEQAMGEALAQMERYGLRPKHVAGNQDIGDKPDPTMPTNPVTPQSLERYHRLFGPSWYSWDQAGLHFIVLNSQVLNTDLPARFEQRQWLEADLAAHSDKRIFVFLHLSPFLKEPGEPYLGHYDNIAQPDRRWLIELLNRYSIELVCSGHSHFSFFNRLEQTRHLVVVSTSFTRPGFSELFSAPPPPDQGRDDAPKLGFYLMRVQDEGTRAHFIRTGGNSDPLDPASQDRHLLTRLPRDLPQSPLGVVLRHPLTHAVEVPLAWPSAVRQPVRNDYPLLACLEMGLRHASLPGADLADPLQAERLALLRDEGVQLTASWLWSGQPGLAETVQQHRTQLDYLELQLPGTPWPDEACLREIRRCRADAGLSITLSAIIPGEPIPGKQLRRTRRGYRLHELAGLDNHLSESATFIDRVLCRLPIDANPWDEMAAALSLPPLTSIGAIDWIIEFAAQDEALQLRRAAEAIFSAARFPHSRLFLEPLIDQDRTMDVTFGLLDRLCNPRPVFNLVRCLNTILFAEFENWQPIPAPPLETGRALGLRSKGATCWLLLPDQPQTTTTTLPHPTLQTLTANTPHLQVFNLTTATVQTRPTTTLQSHPLPGGGLPALLRLLQS